MINNQYIADNNIILACSKNLNEKGYKAGGTTVKNKSSVQSKNFEEFLADKTEKWKSPEILHNENNLYNTASNFNSERQEYKRVRRSNRPGILQEGKIDNNRDLYKEYSPLF